MNKVEFEIWAQSFFDATDEQLEQIEQYKKFLQQKNKEFNLTRLDNNKKIYGEYFFDSIYPYKDIDFKNVKTVLDVGSGSGIPGILLKIFHPDIELTIVESVNKKVEFLKQLCQELNLKNVIVLNKRAEELDSKYRNYFDLTTARAVADLDVLLELLIPYTKKEGLCAIPKGKNAPDELHNAQHIIKKLKISLFTNQEYINSSGHTNYLLCFNKQEDTPTLYPRTWRSIMHEHGKYIQPTKKNNSKTKNSL